MIHTFSPNWYKPQCLFFHNGSLYYASNYSLYRYSLWNRRVECERCFRKLAMTAGMNFKDIKISTISMISEQWLAVGINQPYLVLVDAQDLKVLGVVEGLGIESVWGCCSGWDERIGEGWAVVVDVNGALARVAVKTPSNCEIQAMESEELPKTKPKQLANICNYNLLVLSRGQIKVFNKYF
jgi:hypothetical protein